MGDWSYEGSDDLDWRTIWTGMAKFGWITHVGEGCISRWSAIYPLQEGGTPALHNFEVSSISAYTLWCRTTKFDAITHMRRFVLWGQPQPRDKGVEPQCSSIRGVLVCLWLQSLKMHDQIWRGNTYGEGLVSRHQPHPLSQGGVALADPNFAGSPLLIRTWLDLEKTISVW